MARPLPASGPMHTGPCLMQAAAAPFVAATARRLVQSPAQAMPSCMQAVDVSAHRVSHRFTSMMKIIISCCLQSLQTVSARGLVV